MKNTILIARSSIASYHFGMFVLILCGEILMETTYIETRFLYTTYIVWILRLDIFIKFMLKTKLLKNLAYIANNRYFNFSLIEAI